MFWGIRLLSISYCAYSEETKSHWSKDIAYFRSDKESHQTRSVDDKVFASFVDISSSSDS